MITICGGLGVYKFNGTKYVYLTTVAGRTTVQNPQISNLNGVVFVAINTPSLAVGYET